MSGFPIKKTLDDFDFSFQPSIDKRQIDELATMRFLENGENVVFLAMVLFCIVLGTISSYLFFKTESVWPCVLFHAAVNGIDLWTPESLFMSVQANPFLGPNLTGVLGGAGFLVLACLCFAAIWKAERRAVA